MTEPQADANDSGASQGSPQRRERTLVGKLTLALVWVSILYLVGAGFAGVVPDVFWPDGDSAAATATDASCDDEMRDLKAALDLQFSEGFASALRGDARSLGPVHLEEWDRRYRAVAASCAAEGRGGAHTALGRYRFRLAERVERMLRELARLAETLEGARGTQG